MPRVPQVDGLAILNGFAGIDGGSGAEGFARVPYPLAGDLEVDRVSLKAAPERAQLREQSYDFGRGELRTVLDFDAGEVRAELQVLTFCSRTMPMLVLQEVRVSVSRACDVVLAAGRGHDWCARYAEDAVHPNARDRTTPGRRLAPLGEQRRRRPRRSRVCHGAQRC